MSICSSVVQDCPSSIVQTPRRSFARTRRLLWIATMAIAIGMSAAYLLPQHFRNTSTLYGFAAVLSFFARVFQFHVALVACAIAGLALLIRAKSLAIFASIVAIVLLLPTFASLLPRAAPAPAGQSLRVMSINLLYDNRAGDAILRQIRSANPDVIAFQEYNLWADDLLQRELKEYPYRAVETFDDDASDTAIFSKVPMQGEIQHSNNRLGERIQARATLKLDGREVALYSIHPASPYCYSNVLRNRLETADLIDELRNEKLPVIVAGDFNATPLTANLAAFDALGFKNTHGLAGWGRGSTWINIGLLRYLPGFRIDHILISPQLTCTRSEVCGCTGSDHRPIIADVAWAR